MPSFACSSCRSVAFCGGGRDAVSGRRAACAAGALLLARRPTTTGSRRRAHLPQLVRLKALRHVVEEAAHHRHDLVNVDNGLFVLDDKLLCGLDEVCSGGGGGQGRGKAAEQWGSERGGRGCLERTAETAAAVASDGGGQ